MNGSYQHWLHPMAILGKLELKATCVGRSRLLAIHTSKCGHPTRFGLRAYLSATIIKYGNQA